VKIPYTEKVKGSFPFLPWVPLAAIIAVFIIVFLLCSGCYTVKQGTTLLGYLNRAVPLEKLASENAAEEDQLFAGRVAGIRRFAMEELGLKESKNYTRYVQLDRDYLAAVVSACAADSFTRHEWHFPVVGTVPYKGFFDPEDAQKEAAKLRAKGLDVWIRGVDAFSTLGWFRDPLYSYMKNYPVHELAELIIHELLHATVFVKGQVQFNEQLAEFVGSAGARLYVESRFGPDSPEYGAIDANQADQAAFRAVTGALIAELETLYGGGLSREETLAEKERIIKAAQRRFDDEYDDMFQSENYRGFSKLTVNNAYLDLYRLYYEKDSFFADLYENIPPPVMEGSPSTAGALRLRAFIAAASSLNGSRAARKDPRGEMVRAISGKNGL
jgi:predicted aminopeptidase